MSRSRDERVMKSWRNLSGEVMFRPIPAVTWRDVKGGVALEAGGSEPAFVAGDPAVDFLDFMIGVALSRSPHVHPEDAHRLAATLWALREHEVVVHRHTEHARVLRVEAASLEQLQWITDEWVSGLMTRNDAHPLAASYAIDAVEFLDDHMDNSLGRWDGRGVSGVIRWDAPGGSALEGGFRRWMDTGFKRDMTKKNLGGLLAECLVPPGCAWRSDEGKDVRSAGQRFLFLIRRCHLSTTRQEHRAGIEGVSLEDGEAVDHNGFVFRGQTPVKGQMAQVAAMMAGEPLPPLKLATSPEEVDGHNNDDIEVPGRWMVAAFRGDNTRCPVPAWDPRKSLP